MFQFDSSQFSHGPGVYLMKDERGRILYVGKAKSLKKRLASYFRALATLTPKTQALVAKIRHIETLLTATEKEALLLEESLIKKHRPRYNIVLRDDKQYVLFRLTKGRPWPRLSLTRRVERDGSVYFGPFTSAASARETWRLIGRIFPLRKCSDHVLANRVRPCLYHYIGQCLGPCVLPVDPAQYAALVAKVEMLLAGRSSELARSLETEMHAAAEDLRFEQAAVLRDQLAALQKTVERQTVVLPEAGDLDVLDMVSTDTGLAVGLLFIRQGRLLGQKAFAFPGLGLQEGPEVVASLLPQFYTASKAIPPLIVCSYPPEDPTVAQVLAERRGGPVRLREAKPGAEVRLGELARNAAREFQRLRQEQPLEDILQAKLHLSAPPRRIECIDASHLGGQGLRVGMVVYEEGEARKDDYRVYAFPELEGTSDDYRALASWAVRRLESGEPWPDLVLLDGGQGQLAAVERAMEEAGAAGRFELASIAKGNTRAKGELGDVIFRPGRKNPMPLKPGSPELLFLQRIRDSAHNFVLGRQRQGRAKVLTSELLRLPGVGPKTAKLLWAHFASLDEMVAASQEQLAAIEGLGKGRAARIHAALAGLRRE